MNPCQGSVTSVGHAESEKGVNNEKEAHPSVLLRNRFNRGFTIQ